ncbi:hypothetical protein [Helicobacter trogontum]|uniref:hypothetical protein n=1 Tax=Helicobacter trogontum TaxID=50960 RepID=UPI0023AAF5C0|nr:hypothetical protein [Helicobacter trogontum]
MVVKLCFLYKEVLRLARLLCQNYHKGKWGGDGGRESAKMLQFKINPLLLMQK